MTRNETLLILGASTRAAAFSARRAGLTVACADLFADADLRAQCPVERISSARYPRAFKELSALEHPGPWMYTGALENHPDLVDAISERRTLWGNPGAVLRRVRSPVEVARALVEAGVPCPALHQGERPPPAGAWVVKPVRGAGGRGIRRYTAGHPLRRRPRCYLQEYIPGLPCAAVYLGQEGSARLLGVTQQLVSETWLHARPFHYCGSIGPLALDSATTLRFESLGDVLARGFGLRGLFGVDCLLHEGIPWPVEVNPRYTASVEVLEYALGTPALALHRAAFDPAAPHTTRAAPCGGIAGKAILHARADDAFPHSGPWQTALASSADPLSALPEYADIPGAGEPMARGQPILTLFARAATVAECLAALRERAHDLDRRLFGR